MCLSVYFFPFALWARSPRTQMKVLGHSLVCLLFRSHRSLICLSVNVFAQTAHSFAYSVLLASLARSAALICSLASSLTPELTGKRFFVHFIVHFIVNFIQFPPTVQSAIPTPWASGEGSSSSSKVVTPIPPSNRPSLITWIGSSKKPLQPTISPSCTKAGRLGSEFSRQSLPFV